MLTLVQALAEGGRDGIKQGAYCEAIVAGPLLAVLGAPLQEGVIHALHIQLIAQIRPLEAVIHLLQRRKALHHQHHPIQCCQLAATATFSINQMRINSILVMRPVDAVLAFRGLETQMALHCQSRRPSCKKIDEQPAARTDLDFVEGVAQDAAADEDGAALGAPPQHDQPAAQLQHAVHVHLIHIQQRLGHCGQPQAVVAEVRDLPRVRAEGEVSDLQDT